MREKERKKRLRSKILSCTHAKNY